MGFRETSDTIRAQLHLGGVATKRTLMTLIVLAIMTALLATAFVSAFKSPEFAVLSKEESFTATEETKASEGFSASSEEVSSSAVEDTIASNPIIYTHVAGCVVSPGVYALPVGSRVVDAVKAAGGFKEHAAEGYFNQARLVSDGERIYVPSVDEVDDLEQDARATWLGDAASVQSKHGTGLVNINTAGLDQLITLDGIGEATARKIIAYREETGAFASPEDLMGVSGIGQKKFNAIADYICV